MSPNITIEITVTRRAVPSSLIIVLQNLREMQRGENHIDDLDADEGHDDAAKTVEHHVLEQHAVRTLRLIPYAAQRQRNQRDDDERVEDDRRKDRALRRRQPHDV